MKGPREYIGDGLWASRDRWGTITISTQRNGIEHFIVLDDRTFDAFKAWVARTESTRRSGFPVRDPEES